MLTPQQWRSWSRVGDIGQWMCANQLKLNQDITQFIWLGGPQQLSKLQLQTIMLGGVDIMISTEAMCLGMLLDSLLTFAPHAQCLSGQSFYHLRQMNTVCKSLTEDAATTTVHVYVTIRVLHRVNAASVHPLQSMLNATAQIILRKRKFDHITTDVRDHLHWLPVQQRIEYKVSEVVYRRLHKAAQTHLAELCSPVSESANCGHLHSAAQGYLAVPHSITTRYGQRRFAVSVPTLWNSLPLSVRDPSLTLTQFCAHLKTVILQSIQNTSIVPT